MIILVKVIYLYVLNTKCMVQEKIITSIDHKKLLNDFVQYALLQLGELKIKDISNKVNSSKKINNFLIETRNYNGLLSTYVT